MYHGTSGNGYVQICTQRTSISPNTCSIQHPGSVMDAFNPFTFIHNEYILAYDYADPDATTSSLASSSSLASCKLFGLPVPAPSTSPLPCPHRVHRVRYPSEDRRLLTSERVLECPIARSFSSIVIFKASVLDLDQRASFDPPGVSNKSPRE